MQIVVDPLPGDGSCAAVAQVRPECKGSTRARWAEQWQDAALRSVFKHYLPASVATVTVGRLCQNWRLWARANQPQLQACRAAPVQEEPRWPLCYFEKVWPSLSYRKHMKMISSKESTLQNKRSPQAPKRARGAPPPQQYSLLTVIGPHSCFAAASFPCCLECLRERSALSCRLLHWLSGGRLVIGAQRHAARPGARPCGGGGWCWQPSVL
jgi:hypothetical protein